MAKSIPPAINARLNDGRVIVEILSPAHIEIYVAEDSPMADPLVIAELMLGSVSNLIGNKMKIVNHGG